MASVELQLISNIIKKGDLHTTRRLGVAPSSFQTEEGKEMYRWLLEEFSDRDSDGEVPSLDRVYRHFPDFDYCPSRDSIKTLITDLTKQTVAAGVREAMEEIDQLITEEGENPMEVLQMYLPRLRELNFKGGPTQHLTMSGVGERLQDEYLLMKETGGITGLAYPWAPLNEATGGMHPGDFTVIYGRPKNMKTWIGLSIAAYAYQNNARVLVYSKEMEDIAMARRCSSIIAQVDYEMLRTGRLSDEEAYYFFECLEDLKDWERSSDAGRHAALNFISDRGIAKGKKGATVDLISAEAEKFEPDLVLVDGFYLMRDGRTGVRSRDWKQISNISSDLKEMAQHLQCPLLGTTQANRSAVGSKGDELAELGFADAIGQDADMVMRTFKGKNLATGKPKVLLTFPGVRDAVLNPFVVNAWPGKDFSLLQRSVNVESFLKDKQTSDEEDENASGGAAPGAQAPGKRFNKNKVGNRKKPRVRIR